MNRKRLVLIAIAGLVLGAASARAEVTLLLEEPFGTFGGMNPTGHTAIYLSRVCAASPVFLRRCRPGELGVVISRYHRVAGRDWLAIPVVSYLYAVERPDEVPAEVSESDVAALRDQYRRKFLEAIVPDQIDGSAPEGEWIQLVGAAYDRTLYGFGIESTPEQDDKFIQAFNARPNEQHFNLLFHNCADFVRHAVNFYYPRAIHRSFSADVGIMTPKQAAKCLARYSKRHPQLQSMNFIVAQVPGTVPRSRPVRGVLESVLKSKRYILPLAPLAVLHPYFGGTLAFAWFEEDRFNPRRLVGPPESGSGPELIARELESSGTASPPEKKIVPVNARQD